MIHTPSQKSFYALRPGEVFTAMVEDIRPGVVVLRLAGGANFSARTSRPPQARIGHPSRFQVKENDMNGRIALEILPPQGESERIVKGILARAKKDISDLPLGVSIFEATGFDGDRLVRTTQLAKDLGLAANDARLAALCELMPSTSERRAAIRSILDDSGLFDTLYAIAPPGALPLFHPSNMSLREYYVQLAQKLCALQDTEHTHAKLLQDALERIKFFCTPPRKYFQVMTPHAPPARCDIHITSATNAIVLHTTKQFGAIEVRIDTKPGGVFADFAVERDWVQDVVKAALQRSGNFSGACRVTRLARAVGLLDAPIADRSPPPVRHTFDMRV